MTPPKLPDLPSKPPLATSWPSDPPDSSPFTGTGLLLLLNDAAHRAHGVLTSGAPTGLECDPVVDLARRASVELPPKLRKAMAKSAGTTVGKLNQQAEAYRLGGTEGVHLLNEPVWDPAAETMSTACSLIAAASGEEPLVKANSITTSTNRYKLGHGGRWIRHSKSAGRWLITGAPADSVADLL